MFSDPGALRSLNKARVSVFLIVTAAVLIALGVVLTGLGGRELVSVEAQIEEINLVSSYYDVQDHTEHDEYEVIVSYTVDGVEYTSPLNRYSSSFEVGDKVTAYYEPGDCENLTNDPGILNIIMFALGGLALVFGVKGIVSSAKSGKERRERAEAEADMPAEYVPGEGAVKYYFGFDKNVTHQGHIMEDEQRRAVYEAVMRKNKLVGCYEFDFIDHLSCTSTPHSVGHTVNSRAGLMQTGTFSFDGENVWDVIHSKGISIKTELKGGGIGVKYVLKQNGLPFALVSSCGIKLHEEDAERAGALGNVPASGFYRIVCDEGCDIDALFLTVFAIARSEQLVCE